MTKQKRPYDSQIYGPLKGLDYTSKFPFSGWQDNHLRISIGGWLSHNPPALELATLALEELTRRRSELEAEMKFADYGLQPIGWLAKARKAVRDLADRMPASTKGRGRIYVVLRDGYTSQNEVYGAYVGSTVKPIEKRYLEHRKGPRGARGLKTHGIEILYSLNAGLNPVAGNKTELRTRETRLHEALAPVIPRVTGDVAF
ncbi:MAG: hypothetical protein JKY49_02215 [Cohaesibacteraceae bacterium]|nr:hypothetical protein [Cohaesibacteraceae bacterium]MBL4875652.1 hypothetical protein [Cohaesibacteraceae bacterium]